MLNKKIDRNAYLVEADRMRKESGLMFITPNEHALAEMSDHKQLLNEAANYRKPKGQKHE
jgi:hypothetical protein